MTEHVIPIRVQHTATYQVTETVLFQAIIDIANGTKRGQWLEEKNGKKVVMEERYGSHRFDSTADKSDQTPERIKEIELADELMKALQRYRVATGKL